MVVLKRRLLTPSEEEIISRFIRERVKVQELRELLIKYRPKLTNALGQQIKNTSKTWEQVVKCPIDKFLVTLKDLLEDENIPTEHRKRDLDFYKYKMSQFYSLESMLSDFLCGYECPSCPAPIVS